MNENFLDLAIITYFTPETAQFYQTKNGFAAMKAFLPPLQKDDLIERAASRVAGAGGAGLAGSGEGLFPPLLSLRRAG